MQKLVHHIICLTTIIVCLISPQLLSAAPREVTLFPDAAYVTEVIKIRLQTVNHDRKKAVFILPAKADPASLTCGLAQPTKMQIEDLSWRQIVPDDDDTLKTLRSRLKKAQDEKNDLLAHIKSLEAQIQFWLAQAKGKAKNNAEAANTVAAVGRNLRILYREKFTKEPELEKFDKRIADISEEIEQQEKRKEALWEITLLISGAQTGEATLQYSYLVGSCGWTPHYRIEANTQTRQIKFIDEANIWQNNAVDWHQVDLHLAGQQTMVADQPAGSSKDPKGRVKINSHKTVSPALSPAKEPPVAHRHVSEPITCNWHLGVLDLPSGSTRKVSLKNNLRPADFTYLLTPAQGPHAAIMASVDLSEAGDIPSHDTTIVIDGNVVTSKVLTLSGHSGKLFLGLEPQVTAERHMLKKSTTKSAPDKQIVQFDYLIEVTNRKSTPVKILLEEPLPPSTDSSIKLTAGYDPPPSEQDSAKMLWTFELPAGGKKIISAFVRHD